MLFLEAKLWYLSHGSAAESPIRSNIFRNTSWIRLEVVPLSLLLLATLNGASSHRRCNTHLFSNYFVLMLGQRDRIWTPSLEEDGPEKQVQDRLQLWQTYSQHDSCKHDNRGREPELRDKDMHGNDITAKKEVCIGPTLRKQMELSGLFTRLAYVWLMSEAAANVAPDSTIPSLSCAASMEVQAFSTDKWRQVEPKHNQ